MMNQTERDRITRGHALVHAVDHAKNVAPYRRDLPDGDEVLANARKFHLFLTGQETDSEAVKESGDE